MKLFRLLLFPLLCSPLFLLSQQEDGTAVAVHYGVTHSTARLARTTLIANLETNERIELTDRPVKWMQGYGGGISVRTNTNGRVSFSVAGDYFDLSDRDYTYATLPASSLRLPLQLTADNRYVGFRGRVGIHYRLTPPTSKLDATVGLNYSTTFYTHNYATFLEYAESSAGVDLVGEERLRVSSRRQGGSVTGRVALPVVARVGLTLDADYGLEVEQGTFDQLWMLRAGIVGRIAPWR